MQLKEILAIENDRTDVTRSVIHLFQEGSFYRAYEWSAWLCHRYINQFKVTHKQFRGVDASVLFVGFPVTSLPKYAGDSVALVDVDEKLKDILLPENVIPDDMSLEIMSTDYETWKSTIPLSEPVSKKKKTQETVFSNAERKDVTPATKGGIMQQILAFPLENKTPIQCMTFIAELKQQVVSIM